MFSRFTRLPLRHYLHTSPPRIAATLGVTAVTATYITWRVTSDTHRIALDSTTKLSHSPIKPSSLSTPSEPILSRSPADHPVATGSYEQPLQIKNASPEASDDTTDTPITDSGTETTPDSAGSSGGAYNPVTGEINWDCSCLGGMAYGPCGLQFREAFSCFVFSEEEPKGINCIEKFKAMQNCFREHPETYGDEIMDDEDDTEPTPSTTEHGMTQSTNYDSGHTDSASENASPSEATKSKIRKDSSSNRNPASLTPSP